MRVFTEATEAFYFSAYVPENTLTPDLPLSFYFTKKFEKKKRYSEAFSNFHSTEALIKQR